MTFGPSPMVHHEVGIADGPMLVYRDQLGRVSPQHPAAQPEPGVPIGCTLMPDGSTATPLMPPPESPFEMVPDMSGGVCYYDRDSGSSQWAAPDGSTPLVCDASTRFGDMPHFADLPPTCPRELGLASLRWTQWLTLFSDVDDDVRLYHIETGSTRDAPWVSMRDMHGGIYFANLTTRETRWLPPRTWMRGWRSRMVRPADSTPYGSPFDDTRLARELLPIELARVRVEGGAPYMYEARQGAPRYARDVWDTEHTYPCAGAPKTAD